MSTKAHRNALQAGYELHWYRIKRILGQGAFGITYLSHDINLDRLVAIKEYMPSQLSVREEDMSIQALSDEHSEDFKWGLQRFISEARTLCKFEHPNLVRVYNVFEANNTAYMVMNYEVGDSLKQLLKGKKTLTEPELIGILFPLMDGLEIMHTKGFVHRDIKPGNIFIRYDGSPVLLDFGSARQTRSHEEPQTLTNFVSPGYAPIEQYSSKSDRQGPWTDIYGLGATLYKAITGIMPIAAIDRNQTLINDIEDDFITVTQLAKDRYSEKFLAAVDHALAFKAKDRPQTIAAWRSEFGIEEQDIGKLSVPLEVGRGDATTIRLKQKDEATIDLSKEMVDTGSEVDSVGSTITIDTIGEQPTADPGKTHEQTIKLPEQPSAEMEDSDAEAPTIIAGSATERLTKITPAEVETKAHADPKHIFLVTGVTVVTIILLAILADFLNRESEQTDIEVGTKVAQVEPEEPVQTDVTEVAPTSQTETGESIQPGSERVQVEQGVPDERVTAAAAKPKTRPNTKPNREVQIKKLLTLAKRDIKALKLTKPKGNNAYEKYRKVLSLDKNNKTAKQGIQSIADKYVQFADSAIDANRFNRAKYYLSKAAQVSPGSQNTLEARIKLQTKIFNQNNSRFSRQPGSGDQDSESSSDRVKRVLGGS